MRSTLEIAALTSALAVSACRGPEDYVLHTAGPAADRLAWLGFFGLVLFSATCVVMWALIGGSPCASGAPSKSTRPSTTREGRVSSSSVACSFLSGGSLENDTASLAAWVTHAQSLEPGSQMPDLRRFSGEELLALVAYLQSLR